MNCAVAAARDEAQRVHRSDRSVIEEFTFCYISSVFTRQQYGWIKERGKVSGVWLKVFSRLRKTSARRGRFLLSLVLSAEQRDSTAGLLAITVLGRCNPAVSLLAAMVRMSLCSGVIMAFTKLTRSWLAKLELARALNVWGPRRVVLKYFSVDCLWWQYGIPRYEGSVSLLIICAQFIVGKTKGNKGFLNEHRDSSR